MNRESLDCILIEKYVYENAFIAVRSDLFGVDDVKYAIMKIIVSLLQTDRISQLIVTQICHIKEGILTIQDNVRNISNDLRLNHRGNKSTYFDYYHNKRIIKVPHYFIKYDMILVKPPQKEKIKQVELRETNFNILSLLLLISLTVVTVFTISHLKYTFMSMLVSFLCLFMTVSLMTAYYDVFIVSSVVPVDT